MASDARSAMSKGLSNSDSKSLSSKYRHKNQNSIYYIRPKTKEMYLLDFKNQGFVKENIDHSDIMPSHFSTV